MTEISKQIAKTELNPWDLDYPVANEIESQFCQENTDLFPALCSPPVDQYICLADQKLNQESAPQETNTSHPLSDLRSCIYDASCPDHQRIEAVYD